MRPQADEYPDYLERAVRALIANGLEAGAEELQPIAFEPREQPPRPEVSRFAAGQIFQRDKFHCRYCVGKIIPTSIMELISSLYPTIFPFHPYWKGGLTHPAILSRSGVIDHVRPAAWGGTRDEDNLVTACWPCNAIKADFTLEQLGWAVQDPPETDWDGLVTFYPTLWEIAGRPNAKYHRNWMFVLGLDVPADKVESDP